MIAPSFVLSPLIPKTKQQRRSVNYRETPIRYLVVFLAIFTVMVYEYCNDTPSALEQNIQKNYRRQNNEQLGEANFNLLYAIYSLPNIVVPILGGVMIDRVGARVVFVVTAILCVLGQFIFSMGGLKMIFWMMLVGRMVYGFGGEVIQGSQSTIISNWFKPHQLSFVLGICLCFPKFGSALTNYVTPKIAQYFAEASPQTYQNVGYPLFVGFFGVCLGLIAAIRKNALIEFWPALTGEASKALISPEQGPVKQKGQLQSQLTDEFAKNASVPVYQVDMINENQSAESAARGEAGEHLNFKAICKFSGSFWLVAIISTLQEAMFVPFLDNGNKYYVSVFRGIDNPDDAGIYLSIPYFLAAVLVPILGILVGKVQKRTYLIVVSCFFYFLTFGFMLFMETHVQLRGQEWVRWLPVSLLGISLALFCNVIIPTVPMIVNPRMLGTAFGLMQVLQNLAIGSFPLLIGFIRQFSEDNELQAFHWQSMFLFLVSCICLGCSFLLKAIDMTTGSRVDTKDFRKKYLLGFKGQKNDN